MSRAPDLSTIDAAVELETITFDFGRVMVTGNAINSATVTCAATLGLDPSPASRLVGSYAIVASPVAGDPLQAVTQQVGSMIAGETYRLNCTAVCSDGQHLNLWVHLPCVAVGP